jgi:predicted phage terminase large subunit-like protein
MSWTDADERLLAQKMKQEAALREEQIRLAAKEDYGKYVEYVHMGRWIPAKHLLFICDKIEKLIAGNLRNEYDEKTKILIIQMPPQHGKSQSVTETLPSYYLGKWPHKRVIEVSYGDDLARRFGRRNKQKIEEFGKNLFDIELSRSSKSDTDFEIDGHRGSMISRGIMAGITGQPGDLIIIDDPIKNRQEADSETHRERVWEEWLNSIKTRLSADGIVILIQTRWHEDDLAGRMLVHENGVYLINLPCEAEEGDVLDREIGEPLFPDIGKDKEWINEFKKVYMKQEGARSWLALFQGRPTALEGNLIKRIWWKYWKPKDTDYPPVTLKTADGEIINIYAEELPDYWDEQIQSWDCTFKDNEQNDYVCGGVWGRRIENYYLLDLVNEHLDLPGTMSAIETYAEKWPKALKKYIEDKANGPAVIQMLKRKLSGMLEVQPEGGKEARVSAVSPSIQSGNVYIPHPHLYNWVNEFLNQCSAFPNGVHDDMVDMTSQALNKLIYRTKDTQPTDGLSGTYTYQMLRMKGYKDIDIKKMWKSGQIKLIGHPWKDHKI